MNSLKVWIYIHIMLLWVPRFSPFYPFFPDVMPEIIVFLRNAGEKGKKEQRVENIWKNIFLAKCHCEKRAMGKSCE